MDALLCFVEGSEPGEYTQALRARHNANSSADLRFHVAATVEPAQRVCGDRSRDPDRIGRPVIGRPTTR